MSKLLRTLEDVEDRLQDVIQLLRALYPNFNSIPHADRMMSLLVDANEELWHLQEAESELAYLEEGR